MADGSKLPGWAPHIGVLTTTALLQAWPLRPGGLGVS